MDIDIWMRIDLFRYTLFTIQITTNKYVSSHNLIQFCILYLIVVYILVLSLMYLLKRIQIKKRSKCLLQLLYTIKCNCNNIDSQDLFFIDFTINYKLINLVQNSKYIKKLQ